jgi:hypothetical protein
METFFPFFIPGSNLIFSAAAIDMSASSWLVAEIT